MSEPTYKRYIFYMNATVFAKDDAHAKELAEKFSYSSTRDSEEFVDAIDDGGLNVYEVQTNFTSNIRDCKVIYGEK
jgi:hypothetical protein